MVDIRCQVPVTYGLLLLACMLSLFIPLSPLSLSLYPSIFSLPLSPFLSSSLSLRGEKYNENPFLLSFLVSCFLFLDFSLFVFFVFLAHRLFLQVAQQMSGRAGRRGLDTQGNLLYMNMSWPKIQGLMLGDIPAIVGKDPQYPTMALHRALSGKRGFLCRTYVLKKYISSSLVD